MSLDYNIVIHLGAGLLIGLLIGIERGWSGRDHDEEERMAGMRTFSLIGLLGAIWGQISQVVGAWALAAALVVVSALVIVSYIKESQETKDIGVTTEFSMMLTFALGVWAALGYYAYALSTSVIVVALLGLKPVLHRWVRHIETKEIYAGIKLLIISIVLLPLLPNENYGPWNTLNPYWIWWMVVLISGISFIGYIAIKWVGNRMGTLVTAITGGLVSSTAVTMSMAQFAKDHSNKLLFMGGVLISNSIMLIRVPVEVAIVNHSLLGLIGLPIGVMMIGLIVSGVWLYHRWVDDQTGPHVQIDNPFRLSTAIQFGALLAVILVLSEGMRIWFGQEGVYILSMLSGLMDVDAITLSMARLAGGDLTQQVAAMAIILATVVNTIIKGFYFTVVVGFRESIPLLLALLTGIIPGLITAWITLA
jgi:uncharacterized membrane protein (DUF4010 family)